MIFIRKARRIFFIKLEKFWLFRERVKFNGLLYIKWVPWYLLKSFRELRICLPLIFFKRISNVKFSFKHWILLLSWSDLVIYVTSLALPFSLFSKCALWLVKRDIGNKYHLIFFCIICSNSIKSFNKTKNFEKYRIAIWWTNKKKHQSWKFIRVTHNGHLCSSSLSGAYNKVIHMQYYNNKRKK